MPITQVTTYKYACDGCSMEYIGTYPESVYGIIGSLQEFHPSTDAKPWHIEFFACTPKCIPSAIAIVRKTADEIRAQNQMG